MTDFHRNIIDLKSGRRKRLHALIDALEQMAYHGQVVISYYAGEIRQIEKHHSVDLDETNEYETHGVDFVTG